MTAEMVCHTGGFVSEGVGMRRAAGCVEADGLGGCVGFVGFGEWVAFVDFGIGVTEFDGDVSFQFVFESDGLNSRDGFYDGGFSMGHVTDCSYVDGGLAADLRIDG